MHAAQEIADGLRPRPGGGTSECAPSKTMTSADDFILAVREALRNMREGRSRIIPARIGDFEIVAEIGQGTFGVVLLARDSVLECKRAVKIPTLRAIADAATRSKFVDEARHIAAIEHPNVVRVVAAFEAKDSDGLSYIVMEYCPDGSLAAWMKARGGRRVDDARTVARFVAEIAEGIHQAHLVGRLHRDLKPGNILLARVGDADPLALGSFRPKVADFGLAARLRDDGSVETLADGPTAGTPAYMSPEQARGDLQRIGVGSDVYALGAILFELLAGRRLYPQDGREALIGALLSDRPSPSLEEARPDAPRDLRALCRRALEKDPRDRHSTAAEFADHLRRFANGDAIPGSPFLKRVASAARRHPRATAVGGTAAMVLALAASWSWIKVRGDADVWSKQVRAADLSTLPDLIKRRPTFWLVASSLRAQFAESGPEKKLTAAVMLADHDATAADFAVERLLATEPREIKPLAQALNSQISGLTGELEAAANTLFPRSTSETIRETNDRRRANAAAALVLLGRPELGWPLLRFAPDPQARSFLIHLLGPAGVEPRVILDRLRTEPDTSIRRALVQCLGETPEEFWTPSERDRARAHVLGLYEKDSDSGVHGSCRWALSRWGMRNELRGVDGRISSSRSERRWRVSSSGLTLVKVQVPGGRTIEVADREISTRNFSRFFPDHKNAPGLSPSPDHPVTNVNYVLAAEFCNFLSVAEGIQSDDLAFRKGESMVFEPSEGYLDRAGYRLLTTKEYENVCRAGTTSTRYYGSGSPLLSKYAFYGPLVTLETLPGASLKPNDFGLFDMLGNLNEICQGSPTLAGPKNQAAICGGSLVQPEFAIRSDAKIEPMRVDQSEVIYSFGFRVARTLRRTVQ
jgi:serine/threonine protein kinase